jgi:hypothetical protein
MSRLSELRKSRSVLASKVSQDLDSGGRQDDKRFWKLTRDAAGVGSAVIRFLPPVGGDELPWVKLMTYAFKGPTGKWFINNCPTTIGKESPIIEANAELYATKNEDDKKLAGERKRKTKYISNVLVIKDPANPANEGKVMLFSYGKSIHDMIVTKMRPEFDDQESIEVWDVDQGANFKLRVKNKDKYPTYENSEFDSVSAMFGGDDDKIEAALDACHSLAEFVAPDQFKSYEQLKAEFLKVINAQPTQSAASRMEAENEEPVPQARQRNVEPVKVEKSAPAEKATAPTKVEKKAAVVVDDSDSDDISFFKALLADA